MHWSTYEQLCDDLEAAYREWDEASHAELLALKQRMSAVSD